MVDSITIKETSISDGRSVAFLTWTMWYDFSSSSSFSKKMSMWSSSGGIIHLTTNSRWSLLSRFNCESSDMGKKVFQEHTEYKNHFLIVSYNRVYGRKILQVMINLVNFGKHMQLIMVGNSPKLGHWTYEWKSFVLEWDAKSSLKCPLKGPLK